LHVCNSFHLVCFVAQLFIFPFFSFQYLDKNPIAALTDFGIDNMDGLPEFITNAICSLYPCRQYHFFLTKRIRMVEEGKEVQFVVFQTGKLIPLVMQIR